MEERSRYSVSAKGAGMDKGVLKNKLGIKTQRELDDAETLLLSDAYTHFFDELEKDGLTFDLPFLFEIHRYFLKPLYSWAGKVRSINISKGDVLFAPAEHLEKSLDEFGKFLSKNLPTKKDSKSIITSKLALIHNELNVLHPFREGNGRTIRLFLDLVAASSGWQPIDWSQSSHKEYIDACKQGVALEHEAMKKVIFKGLSKKTLA